MQYRKGRLVTVRQDRERSKEVDKLRGQGAL